MRALSKLINENEPELVLFVGEALVGNDGVNQLEMFNQVPQISSWNMFNLFCAVGQGSHKCSSSTKNLACPS